MSNVEQPNSLSMLRKYEREDGLEVYSLFDIELGQCLSTRRQKSNGTLIFWSGEYELLMTQPPPVYPRLYRPRSYAYLRQRRRDSSRWQVIASTTGEKKEKLHPYLYLIFRHHRGDKEYGHRRNLFLKVPEVIEAWEKFSGRDEVDIQIDRLLQQIFS